MEKPCYQVIRKSAPSLAGIREEICDMEKWEEIYKGKIPKDKYKVQITNSEERGLIIELRGIQYQAIIKFGAVQAIRMLDEGIVQDGMYSDKEIEKYRKQDFENVIYELTDGEFEKTIRKISAGIIDLLESKHYVVITRNFNIDIITEWEPELNVYSEFI